MEHPFPVADIFLGWALLCSGLARARAVTQRCQKILHGCSWKERKSYRKYDQCRSQLTLGSSMLHLDFQGRW